MPFATEVVLIMVGAILSYTLKSLGDKRAQSTIQSDIKDMGEAISDIREILIRNEAIAADVKELKVIVGQLQLQAIEYDKRISVLEVKQDKN